MVPVGFSPVGAGGGSLELVPVGFSPVGSGGSEEVSARTIFCRVVGTAGASVGLLEGGVPFVGRLEGGGPEKESVGLGDGVPLNDGGGDVSVVAARLLRSVAGGASVGAGPSVVAGASVGLLEGGVPLVGRLEGGGPERESVGRGDGVPLNDGGGDVSVAARLLSSVGAGASVAIGASVGADDGGGPVAEGGASLPESGGKEDPDGGGCSPDKVPVGADCGISDSDGRAEVSAARLVKVRSGISVGAAPEGGGPEREPVGLSPSPEKVPVPVGFAGGVPVKAGGELSAAGAA